MTPAPPNRQSVVLVSWDGKSPALAKLHVDTDPQFELVLFDYSGGSMAPVLPSGIHASVMRQATECKGEIYRALGAVLAQRPAAPAYVGLIDDDVILSVSDINRLLHVAQSLKLHALSAALSHDSHCTHRWTMKQTQQLARSVDWVEVMMPFYDGALFSALMPHLGDNISSWGIDKYLVPAVQQITGLNHTAIIDAVTATHMRPVTSGARTYRNGLTAAQEAARLREVSMALVQTKRPELVGSDWFKRIFEQRHSRSRWQILLYGLGRPLRRWLESST